MTNSITSPAVASQTILLTIGTGKTGQRIAARLADHGAQVRVGSRSGTPPFDWADRTTWRAALAGVDAAYVVYYPDIAVPDAASTIDAFVGAARDAGVRRLVMLSGRGEPQAQVSERIIQESGIASTVLRCDWFMQNFSESFLLGAVLEGVVVLPTADVREPFVDLEDVADVAAAALVDDRHSGRVYELSGPESITFADAAEAIGQATGRSIKIVEVTPTEYVEGAVAAGLPRPAAELLGELVPAVLDGRNSAAADGVRQALGRPAASFAAYVRRTAASGAWD